MARTLTDYSRIKYTIGIDNGAICTGFYGTGCYYNINDIVVIFFSTAIIVF